MPTDPLTPDEIQQHMDAAEALGASGDARGAAHAYQQLGDRLKTQLGLHSSVIDAYEGMARWVASPDYHP